MSTIDSSANRVLSWLTEHQRPVVRLLRDGLDDAQVNRLEEELGWHLPQEATDLFRWRNGVREDPTVTLRDIAFLPRYHLLSFQQALADRADYVSLGIWPELWFPVFANGAGDYKILDCTRADGKSAPVIGFLKDHPEVWDEYVTLSAMMETLARGFEKGAIVVGKEGQLSINGGAFATIARDLNPGVEYWRESAK